LVAEHSVFGTEHCLFVTEHCLFGAEHCRFAREHYPFATEHYPFVRHPDPYRGTPSRMPEHRDSLAAVQIGLREARRLLGPVHGAFEELRPQGRVGRSVRRRRPRVP
jgi:hypothetical protein